MSLKRSLSPELNNNFIDNDTRQLKRLKLHSIIQELRNEEASLILLKKLHKTQKLSKPIETNNFHPTTTRSVPLPAPPRINPSLPQQSIQITTHKSSNSPLLINSNKISTHNHSSEERKNQAKLTLRKQLERDLLNIPLPKPHQQDILCIPNLISLEFQFFIGLEDVIQCLNELQNDRQRLPQRFTDHAQIDEPYICDQCGTDFTISWWKHFNNHSLNILCDRCKKQITRRRLKSKHSTLLKSVFISAMKKEKEIEKYFSKQQENSSRSNNHPIQSKITTQTHIPSNYHHPRSQTIKTKVSSPQNFSTKLSQHSIPTRRSNVIVQSQIKQHQKVSIPTHHQQYRSTTALPQQIKNNQMIKISKIAERRQPVMSSSRSIFPSNPDIMNSLVSSNFVRPTTTK